MLEGARGAQILDSESTSSRREEVSGLPKGARLAGVIRMAERAALLGFILYAIFAPHSIAGAEIGLALVALGWLARTLATADAGFGRRTPQDLPIWLFLAWTLLSAFLSAEPAISLAKIQSVCVLFLYYLTRAMVERRRALLLVALMIASGVAGVVWGVVELARGRGVTIEAMTAESPFRLTPVQVGDAVWRMGQRRVSSIEEIDDAIRRAGPGAPLSVSFIKQGEHGESNALLITDEMKARSSPSGLEGTQPTHRFRASGWTRHYETFSETLQILAQLSLGLALAHLRRRGGRRGGWRAWLWLGAGALLALGIMLTAMRTVLVACAIGAAVVAWRAARKRERIFIYAALILLLVTGALAVWRTRAQGTLSFQDASAQLRLRVAGVALSRLAIHPFFGHGMDAVKRHWTEWGFPGREIIHLHSTPLQLAFDRGLPALFFWFWIMASFWRTTASAEKSARAGADANADADAVDRHGLLLGATGSLAGFFASSLVNYNFGDAEVALVFWWLMGIGTKCRSQNTELRVRKKKPHRLHSES